MPARKQSTQLSEEAWNSPLDMENSAAGAGARGRGRDGREKETFACPYPGCGQTYSRMEYLKRHQRKHQDDRPFQCRDCNKAFARSDVLLRHRRRCHPTPPPADRNSNSPPPPHRNYPGVPVSSSRTDAREASPAARGRKHPRRSSSANGPSAQRRRVSDETEDDDDADQFGESSRFGRVNGMGNGGVFGMDNSAAYYGNVGESTTYTPHLLPMFQQNQGYHDLNDPNHLEDASVLLSMAYPGGVPSGENPNGMTVACQQVVPDWEGGQTINMMLENAKADTGDDSSRTQNAPTVAGDLPAAGSAVLPDSMGNFLGTLSWLSAASLGNGAGGKEENTGEGPNSWAVSSTSPKPLSPFPLSSLFSPSAFGLSLPNGTNEANTEDDANNQAIRNILDQLAMYDVPQTRENANPERPLIRINREHIISRQGKPIDPSSQFYLDPQRFAGCYEIPHWKMPPIRTLSAMACRTFHTVLNHFSFVHMPTFRLIDTAACLAFAICTVGGIRTNSIKWDFRLDFWNDIGMNDKADDIDGPVPPGGTWESMYRANYRNGQPGEEARFVEQWDSGQTVRNEKTNMLVKSFSQARGVLMTEYNVALLQALILYHAPFFLSQDERERSLANMFLGTIVNITRQIGFFTTELEHFEPEIRVPEEPYTPNDLNLYWRRWIQLETRRRTAYLVYHLDTVSALESNIPCILTSCEISFIPLPAPDSLWKAATAEEWMAAVKRYKPMTLDEAMRRTFFLPTFGAFDLLHERADTKCYNLLNESDYGPFARVSMALTLLRGVMDIGEGKRDRGDWRDLTDLWVSCSWMKPHKKMLDIHGQDLGPVSRDSLRDRFALGLERWRQGWDFDSLCLSGSPSASNGNGLSPSAGSSSSARSNSAESCEMPAKLNYCEEALPFYWLAQALLNILRSAPPAEPGYNHFKELRYNDMLKSARTFTRLGEGIPATMKSCSEADMFGPTRVMNGTKAKPGVGVPIVSAGAHANGLANGVANVLANGHINTQANVTSNGIVQETVNGNAATMNGQILTPGTAMMDQFLSGFGGAMGEDGLDASDPGMEVLNGLDLSQFGMGGIDY